MKLFVLLLFFGLFCNACATTPPTATHVSQVGVDVRADLSIIEPVSADRVDWSELLFQIKGVDIILLGERHDHAVGHAVQLAVVEDVMDLYPGSVLALEMLERDEQLLVDDYTGGFIDKNEFEKLTNSSHWGVMGGWSAWYQPIIDAVVDRGGTIVAANAPRRYVRLARLEGYERIEELSAERRVFVDYPEVLSGGKYRQRFWEFANHDDSSKDVIDVSVIDPEDPLLPVYKSQQMWDATMAQSVVSSSPTIDKKVVLLVGQFHVEYEGGVVQEIKKRLPNAKMLVVSIQRNIPEEEWRGSPPIADLMIVEQDSR